MVGRLNSTQRSFSIMHTRLCLRFARSSLPSLPHYRCSAAAPFSSASSREKAHDDPATDLMDIVSPRKPKRPDPPNAIPPRDPNAATDGSNSMLSGYPSAKKPGQMTTSTATPDTTTPERGTPTSTQLSSRNRQRTTMASSAGLARTSPQPHDALLGMLDSQKSQRPSPTTSKYQPGRASSRPTPSNIRENAELAAEAAGMKRRGKYVGFEKRQTDATQKLGQLERQASRTWRPGDVYAPHDLTPAEQMKARTARQGLSSRFRMQTRARSRKQGGADAFDVLRLNPVQEYKNFNMMSEFTSEMGRIRGARETGLRAVNQRKLAKAVRRSVGMGLLPSVHKHPELLEERREQRPYVWRRDQRLMQKK